MVVRMREFAFFILKICDTFAIVCVSFKLKYVFFHSFKISMEILAWACLHGNSMYLSMSPR